MTKRFFATLRYAMVFALVAGAFAFSSCDKDDDPEIVVFDGSIYAFISSEQFQQAKNGGNADNSFDSLVMYIDKYPDLKAQLSSSTELTLFAPSNKAFAGLTALPGLKDPDRINPDIIAGVLAYHFVEGKTMKASLAAGSEITTKFAGEKIKINSDGTLLTGSKNDAIVVSTYDQLSTNGVIHTTATVLIPPSTGGQLADILGTVAATVLLGKDFTYMAYLIGLADAGVDAEDSFTFLLSEETNITLLAIPNPVFAGFAAQMLGKANPSDTEIKTAIVTAFGLGARTILENHLLAGVYTVADATPNQEGESFKLLPSVSTYADNTLGISKDVSPAECQCPTGIVLFSLPTGEYKAPIMQADIDTEAGISNGVLQVIGGILLTEN